MFLVCLDILFLTSELDTNSEYTEDQTAVWQAKI